MCNTLKWLHEVKDPQPYGCMHESKFPQTNLNFVHSYLKCSKDVMLYEVMESYYWSLDMHSDADVHAHTDRQRQLYSLLGMASMAVISVYWKHQSLIHVCFHRLTHSNNTVTI